MSSLKCPICNKNYIIDNEEVCSFCKRLGRTQQVPKTEKKIITKYKLTYDYKTKGTYVGTNSHDIYLDMCNRFGWKKEYANHFGKRGDMLYECGVDINNYSVWFLPWNALQDIHHANTWVNKVFNNRIEEEWLTNHSVATNYNKSEKRITFVKDEKGNYRFHGVLSCVKWEYNDNKNIVRTYERISDVYPVET